MMRVTGKKCIEAQGATSERFQYIFKAILLRRTKKQLMETGEITLPSKTCEVIDVELSTYFIYAKLMMYSQVFFANYMTQ
jgi:hypothetical protein